MRELDVTCSHSRPRVSSDNPFSESQFKTQKYQPDYLGRFTEASHAQRWCEAYFGMYLLNLRIEVRERESNAIIAYGESEQTSLAALGKSHDDIIDRALDEMISRGRVDPAK